MRVTIAAPSDQKTDRYHRYRWSRTSAIAALAAEQFHEHGITSTGVDALSRAAGISKRTLYERFGSKDGLIVAAYESLDLPVFQMFTRPGRGGRRTRRVGSSSSANETRNCR